jgi:hypothetical protein
MVTCSVPVRYVFLQNLTSPVSECHPPPPKKKKEKETSHLDLISNKQLDLLKGKQLQWNFSRRPYKLLDTHTLTELQAAYNQYIRFVSLKLCLIHFDCW